MSFTEATNKLGEAIESTFPIMKSLNNTPNIIFITVMSVLFLWWIWKMAQYDKESEQSGSMR